MSRVVVCLPTYNERENLEPVVAALGDVLDTARDRVLVIDDGSPDGTGDIAGRLAAELPWLSVLQRARKEGLGRAYVAGFRRALDEGAELVVTMDCDFSHDPRDVPRLVRATAEADLVIGSRYVRGGGSANRTSLRQLLSRGGSIYARAVLGASVRDLTGGFKCFRRSAVAAIDLERVSVDGYGFHVEATYRVLCAGLRVIELPIRFVDRQAGESKLTAAVVAEAAWKVPALRVQSLTHRL